MTAISRQCGECSLCCKLTYIQAFNKPMGEWCRHFRKGVGCGIYNERPQDCRVFRCMWLDSDEIGDAWFPKRAGLFVSFGGGGNRMIVYVDPKNPVAWRSEPFYSKIKEWSARALKVGKHVCVYVNLRVIVVFPDHEEDLGEVPGHQDIAIEPYTDQIGRRAWRAKIVPLVSYGARG